MLLACKEQPEAFTQTDDIDTILERQSKAELITLSKQSLQKQPEVEWQLTMPPLPGYKSVPIDIEEYRDQVDEAFRRVLNLVSVELFVLLVKGMEQAIALVLVRSKWERRKQLEPAYDLRIERFSGSIGHPLVTMPIKLSWSLPLPLTRMP